MKIAPQLLFFLGWLLCGCSRQTIQQQDYLSLYQKGQLGCAEEILEETVPNPFTSSQNAVMLLLDRATLRFAGGDTQGAIQDYQRAIEAIDYFSQASPADVLAQVTLQDDLGAYTGEDFEQILARVYFALALLQEKDESNALALLRQAEEVQQQKKEIYRKDCLTQDYDLVDNPLAKYLMALLLERKGDQSNADILFKQTEELIGSDLSTLQLSKENSSHNSATVLLIAHNGNAPYKISGIASASVASALALEMMLEKFGITPAISSSTGIPVPVLMQKLASHRAPIFSRLCREERTLSPFYFVSSVAATQLQQKMPLIVARGVVRFAIRRGTVAYFNEQGPCIGALADIGMLVANACTLADTRTWGTLPSSIDLARYEIPPGEHTLHLLVQWGLNFPFVEEYLLQLAPHDLCVINIFNIHPGIVSVQIPHKNKLKKEYFYESLQIMDTNIPVNDDLNASDKL